MRVLRIDQFPKDHFPQIQLLPENLCPKNYVAINHIVDKSQHAYSEEEIADFARKNSATLTIHGQEHFVLLFGYPGNKPITLVQAEISLALNDPQYGQCKSECKRKELCPVGTECKL